METPTTNTNQKFHVLIRSANIQYAVHLFWGFLIFLLLFKKKRANANSVLLKM